MTEKQKRLVYTISGIAAAVCVAVIVLLLLFGGSGKKYDRFYRNAEDAYLSRDYKTALEQLDKAMDQKETEDAYLLLADIYYAQGDTERAIQVLSIGASHVGGSRISEMLTRLKGNNHPLPSAAPQDGLTIGGQPVDPDAESLVLSDCKLTGADMKAIGKLIGLDHLSLSGNGVEDLSPLSGLKNLSFLQVTNNRVEDLSPLSNLKNLKTLYLDENPITDLTPLYTLKNLRTLSMKGIPITDKKLQALQEALPDCSIFTDAPSEEAEELTLGGKKFYSDATILNLSGLNIDDISVLRECVHLKQLDLRDNKIKDISPLLDLQELEWLCLWNNQVEDINALMTLTSLKYLDIDGNKVTDISVVRDLPNLEELWLNNNALKSLDPLKGLTNLQRLGIANTGTDDQRLDVLTGLTSLVELNIKGNEKLTAGKVEALKEALPKCTIAHDDLLYDIKLGSKQFFSDTEEISAVGLNVSDLNGLDKFTKLRILRLDVNAISDLRPLAKLDALEGLFLYSNIISDITPLANHTALKTLDLQENQIQDLSPLASCSHLATLTLADNKITSVTPLSACTELTELNLDNNQIREISGLSPLTSLTTLHLENNQISDLSALYSLVKLETLYIRGNDLTRDDILALQTMLPRCLIIHDVDMTVVEETPVSETEPEVTPSPAVNEN